MELRKCSPDRQTARRTCFSLPWCSPRPRQKTLGAAAPLLGGSRQDQPPLTPWDGRDGWCAATTRGHTYILLARIGGPPLGGWTSTHWQEFAGTDNGAAGKTCRDRRNAQTTSLWDGPLGRPHVPELLGSCFNLSSHHPHQKDGAQPGASLSEIADMDLPAFCCKYLKPKEGSYSSLWPTEACTLSGFFSSEELGIPQGLLGAH